MRYIDLTSPANIILKATSKNIQPKVLSVKNINEGTNDFDQILDIEIYCPINAKIAQTLGIEKIEARLSSLNLAELTSLVDLNIVNNTNKVNKKQIPKRGKNNTLSPPDISTDKITPQMIESISENWSTVPSFGSSNQSANNEASITIESLLNVSTNNINKYKDSYPGTKLIATFNLRKSIKDIEKFTVNKKINIVKKNVNKENDIQKLRSENYFLNSFKKNYKSLIKKEIDPIVIFENPYGKNKSVNKNIYTNQYLMKIFNFYEQKIFSLSKDEYDFQIVPDTSNTRLEKTKFSISLKNLKSFGSNTLYIIYTAKDSKGKKVQTSESIIKIDEIQQQTKKNSIDFNLSSTKSNTGVSKLKIINSDKNNNLELDVFAKKITSANANSFVKQKFVEIENNVKVIPKNSSVLVDGTLNSRTVTPKIFKSNESIFYRGTLTFNNDNYYNCKSSSCKSIKNVKLLNNPHLSISGKIIPEKECVNITIKDISDNIHAIKLKKYKIKGISKGYALDTKNSEFKTNEYIFLGKENTYSFDDYDVDDNKSYIYFVECLMKNSIKKISNENCLIAYSKKKNRVSIIDINIDKTDVILDGENELISELISPVKLSFKVVKVQSEIDKILQNMFGNLFDVVKENIQLIKDTQGLVYSIEIDRINKVTGDSLTIAKLSPDENGNVYFEDNSAPAFDSYMYMLNPRIEFASAIVSDVINLLDNYDEYKNASFNIKQAKKANSTQDSVDKNKNTERKQLKTIKDNIIKNDIFFNKSTGDVYYVDVERNSDVYKGQNLLTLFGSINEIYTVPVDNDKFSHKKNRDEKYFDINFKTNNDYFVDFYIIFIKDDDNIYMDGAMHSTDDLTDSLKEYNYLLKTNKKYGLLEAYLVPVFKNGNAGMPKLIDAKLINLN